MHRPLLPFALLAAIAPVARSECFTAKVTPYDCGSPNPVTLVTSWPGQYPVVGTLFFVEAAGAPANGSGALLLSLGSKCLALPGPYQGEFLLDPADLAILPYALIPKWTFAIPGNPVFAGLDFYMQSAHATGGGYAFSNGLRAEVGFYQAEIEVASVQAPAGLVGSDGTAAVAVTLFNHGNAPADVPVHAQIGASFGDAVLGPVPPFGSYVGTVEVPVPPSIGSCGSSNAFAVSACSNLFDCNGANNCASSQTQIAVPSWDMKFDIVNAPAVVTKCQNTSWKVKVTNLGNVPSDNVCFISGIVAAPGSLVWQPTLGTVQLWTGVIAPGTSKTISVTNYFIGCAAFSGTQYIKAEVHYSAGCFDLCNPGGNNFDQQSVTVVP